MEFSDNKSRDYALVKRSERKMEIQENFYDLDWTVVKQNLNWCFGSPVHLYRIPVKDVKIGEDIYNKKGDKIAYRTT